MPAIENQDSRIEFGQLREINKSPTQLTLNLENSSQSVLFDTSLESLTAELPDFGVEYVVFEDKRDKKNHEKVKGQMDIKAFGAYPDNIPDQLFLHYTDKDSLDLDDEVYDAGDAEISSQIPFQKSALYSRRRNRFRSR